MNEAFDLHDSSQLAGDLLVILRHAPHGSSWLKEGLDAALVAAAFGRNVSLLFSGDGVLALLSEQGGGALAQKGTHPMIEMLPMYDIETLLVDVNALDEHGLSQDDLFMPARAVVTEEIAEALRCHSLILNF